jgi:hypothetical protein
VHGLPDPHPAVPDELAGQVIALRIGGRHDGISLHLHQERFGTRRDRLLVSVRHGLKSPLPVFRPVGRPLESQAGVFHAPGQSGDEDRLLVREEPEEIRLRDADPPGDRRGGGAVVAGDRELGDRRADDALAPLSRTDPAHAVLLPA